MPPQGYPQQGYPPQGYPQQQQQMHQPPAQQQQGNWKDQLALPARDERYRTEVRNLAKHFFSRMIRSIVSTHGLCSALRSAGHAYGSGSANFNSSQNVVGTTSDHHRKHTPPTVARRDRGTRSGRRSGKNADATRPESLQFSGSETKRLFFFFGVCFFFQWGCVDAFIRSSSLTFSSLSNPFRLPFC
jgi:hypothetical protein